MMHAVAEMQTSSRNPHSPPASFTVRQRGRRVELNSAGAQYAFVARCITRNKIKTIAICCLPLAAPCQFVLCTDGRIPSSLYPRGSTTKNYVWLTLYGRRPLRLFGLLQPKAAGYQGLTSVCGLHRLLSYAWRMFVVSSLRGAASLRVRRSSLLKGHMGQALPAGLSIVTQLSITDQTTSGFLGRTDRTLGFRSVSKLARSPLEPRFKGPYLRMRRL